MSPRREPFELDVTITGYLGALNKPATLVELCSRLHERGVVTWDGKFSDDTPIRTRQ